MGEREGEGGRGRGREGGRGGGRDGERERGSEGDREREYMYIHNHIQYSIIKTKIRCPHHHITKDCTNYTLNSC